MGSNRLHVVGVPVCSNETPTMSHVRSSASIGRKLPRLIVLSSTPAASRVTTNHSRERICLGNCMVLLYYSPISVTLIRCGLPFAYVAVCGASCLWHKPLPSCPPGSRKNHRAALRDNCRPGFVCYRHPPGHAHCSADTPYVGSAPACV